MVENTIQATWKRITRSGTEVVSSSKPLVLAKQSSGEEIYDDVLVSIEESQGKIAKTFCQWSRLLYSPVKTYESFMLEL